MYKAIVTVNGQASVTVEGLTPAALGEKIGLAISADVLEEYVDVVFEVNGPITRRLIEDAGPILVSVTPAEPTMAENVITIPTAVGVDYKVDGVVVTDPITLTAENTEVIVVASAKTGYKIPDEATKSWTFTYLP